jgi:hypothetical protein
VRTSFLPRTDAGLLAWSVNFKTLTTATPTVYGLTADQASEFSDAQIGYATAYQKAQDPNTRTTPNVTAKNLARDEMKRIAGNLAKIIYGHGTNDAMLEALGLTVRKTPTRHGAPTVRPGPDIESVNGYKVGVNIHDSASSAKRGKPAGAVAAWVYTFVGETYPSDPTLWDFQGSATTGKFEITFPNTLAGGTQIWICAAWINTRQEAGPVSVPITTNLQGGGSTSSTLKIAA